MEGRVATNVDSSACWRKFTSDRMSTYQNAEPNEDHTDKSSQANAGARERTVRVKPQLDAAASGFSYGDEISHKLSRINGAINQMTKEQMQSRLKEFRLNSSGCKDVLKKRLKNHYKRQKMAQSNKPEEQMKYDYLIVIDFEATCSETNENFIHEIIEFPAVLVDARNKAVCNVFQRFCRPKVNQTLTEFCTNLTGISQEQVDRAKDFKEVFREFEDWMSLHKLGTEHSFAILTDGPWDMARFLRTQLDVSEMEFPKWAKKWINLRKAYTAFYGVGRVNLQHMLEDLGMTFQGRPHCGLDDSRNIAAIAIRLLQDGCLMRVNEYLHEEKSSLSTSSLGQLQSQQHSSTPSSPKGRLTQAKRLNCKAEASVSPDVPQEGDNVEDLLEYLKIQQS